MCGETPLGKSQLASTVTVSPDFTTSLSLCAQREFAVTGLGPRDAVALMLMVVVSTFQFGLNICMAPIVMCILHLPQFKELHFHPLAKQFVQCKEV